MQREKLLSTCYHQGGMQRRLSARSSSVVESCRSGGGSDSELNHVSCSHWKTPLVGSSAVARNEIPGEKVFPVLFFLSQSPRQQSLCFEVGLGKLDEHP